MSGIGCGESNITNSSADFVIAQSRWAIAEPASYDITLQVSCFCDIAITRPVIVSVRNGVVTRRVYVSGGADVPAIFASSFPDVNGLFAIVANAQKRNVATLETAYSQGFGYPQSIFIREDLNALDDGYSISVIGFSALDTRSRVADLAAARSRWAAQSLSSYNLTVQQSCFCGQDVIQPVVVSVRNGSVVSRTYQASGATVPATYQSPFVDVLALFALIDDAIQKDAYMVQVTYDAVRGNPIKIYIDYRSNVADDEVTITAYPLVPYVVN